MHAYLINLTAAKDRLFHAEQELSKFQIPYTVVNAIKGSELPYPHVLFSDVGYRLLQGRRRIDAEFGCFLSHLKAIQLFWDSGEDYGLILEDDIQFADSAKSVIAQALQAAPFDLLRLSTVNSGRWTKTIPLKAGHFLGVAYTREKGAGAYLLNRKAAKKILANYLPMTLPYDHRFDLEWLDGFRTLGITPPLVTQKGFTSQIQQNVRAHYLPAYLRYWTVFPCRFFWELTRVIFRGYSHIKLKKSHYSTRFITKNPQRTRPQTRDGHLNQTCGR